MPHIVCVGNFDGVHLGHHAILGEARRQASQRGLEVLALAFDPHPATTLRPGAEPPRLMTAAQKIRALIDAGADRVELLAPEPPLLSLAPLPFVRWLAERHAMQAIVEGTGFRFGADRAGDVDLLQQLGASEGFDVTVVDPVEVALGDQTLASVSSTLVRWLVCHGRVADVARCLGRPHVVAGTVQRGAALGRRLGVPTANLDAADLSTLLPADGVYAGSVELPEGERVAAAISIGSRPTVDGQRRLVEAHLLDFDRDLYGRRIQVMPTTWIRDQWKFPSPEHLRRQLQRDVATARRFAPAH